MRTDDAGRGIVSLLHADKLMEAPKLYATLLLWLLTELFRKLPEVGDVKKPKLVFFFDETHLLFRDPPKPVLESVERVVRLVRSKGVGVYFGTQSPADVPDVVLAQLGNRIQHALRVYTPKEQRLVKAAARAFRPNLQVDVERSVVEMGLGEALVSTLIDDGVPSPVERIKVAKPRGHLGPISSIERETMISGSPLRAAYPSAGSHEEAERSFFRRQRELRGLPPLDARPAPAAPVDWDRVLEPIRRANAPRRPNWPVHIGIFGLFCLVMTLIS